MRQAKAQEPSGFRRAVTHVLGLFCNASAKYAQGLRPWRAQEPPLSSALRLCRPGKGPPALRERNPALALAAPAGVGQGQGVSVRTATAQPFKSKDNLDC